jgi:dephospho-CoA kinase
VGTYDHGLVHSPDDALKVLRVGLTGGVACGKSLVAGMFADLGAPLVDTDLIAREVVAPGEPGLSELVDSFGPGILDSRGELDRAKTRALVFADAARRRELERILHPRIRERTLAAVADARGPYVIVVVPLLLETGFDALVDRVLVVDCPADLQLERLMRRDGLDAEQARAMLGAQVGRDERLRAADDVIDNGGTLDATRRQVTALHHRYLELAGVC